MGTRIGALIALGLPLYALGCAPDMPPPGSGPPSSYEILDDPFAGGGETYELPWPELDPKTFLPAELRQGPGHEVVSIRLGQGFVYVYSIETQAGAVEVQGQGMLRKRVHEIDALQGLADAGVEDRHVYVLALANAAEAPAEGGMQLLFHPVKTTTNIPRGMWSMARNYYEMTGAGRTYREDDYFHELIGFGKAKREWAYRLGVDPYSSNPALQAELNRLGWLSLAGGMSVRLPLMAVPGGASIALTVTNTSDDMKRELRDETPEDIRIRSRDLLLNSFGVDEITATEFIYHPWYSPSQQLEIVDSLAAIDTAHNQEAFIRLAVLADTPAETFAFSRLALIFLAFHRHVEPVEEFFAASGLVLGRTRGKNVILPLNVDMGFWTEGGAALVDAIDAQLARDATVREKIILVSGRISPRALAETERRGWTTTQGLEESWLEAFDAEAYAPGEPDTQRILPEIGS